MTFVPEARVRELMRVGQGIIEENNFIPSQKGNMNETALNWGVGPTHNYVANDAERGEQEISDSKGRISSIPLVIGDGW